MTDGLKSEHRRAIIETLSANPKVERIVLFGSRAMGTFTPTSDIDLALFGDDLTLSDQAALAEAMAELAIPQRVDILIHHRIENQALREHIRKHGVAWFARKQASGTPAAARVRRNYSSNRPKPPNSTPPSPPTSRSWAMAGEWRNLSFTKAVLVNPQVRLERGRRYPFVDMGALNPGARSAFATEEREFSGGGSRFEHGDTLMARITPCLENGKIARFCAPERSRVGHGSTEFIVIRGRPGVTHTDFAYYLTLWEGVRGYAISHMTGTSGRQRVPTDCLEHLTVPIPPLPEQHAIAHILGTLDDKIELNRRMSETLEQMARALFKAWFVDFEPVRAKMEGRWQRGQSLPGLPAHLYDLFPDRLVDSELGEIPEGWRVVELEQVIEINPPRVLRRGQCAPYLDMASMPTLGHVPLRVVERPYTSGTRFTNGDTLLARITPCLENGKTAFVDFLVPSEVGWGSTEFIVLRPKPPLPAEFGYCLARDPDFREFAIQSMTGTSGRQRVQPEALARYLLVVPSDDVAQAFGALVEPWFRKACVSERESRTLAALRDALLPKLIRGEIRVKDAERFLEERGL